jgi:hypothetical protein
LSVFKLPESLESIVIQGRWSRFPATVDVDAGKPTEIQSVII